MLSILVFILTTMGNCNVLSKEVTRPEQKQSKVDVGRPIRGPYTAKTGDAGSMDQTGKGFERDCKVVSTRSGTDVKEHQDDSKVFGWIK